MNVRSCMGLSVVLFLGMSAAIAQTPARVELVPQTGHTAGVTSVTFRPDADQVLTGSSDGTAILWDTKNGYRLRTYKGGPLSNSFLTASELQDAKMPATFPLAAKEPPAVAAVEFTPDGRTFLMLCRPEGFLATLTASSQAIVWDVVSGERVRAFDLEPDAAAIALSPDGKQFVSAGQPMSPEEAKEMVEMGAKVRQSTGVVLWDIASGKELRQFGGHDVSYETVQFSADGRYVLAGGSDLATFSAAPPAPAPAQTPATAPDSAAPPAPAPALPSDATKPAPEQPANVPCRGVLKVWDTATGDEILKFQPQNGVLKAAFSPSGQYIMTVDASDKLDVWDIKTKKQVLTVMAKTGAFSIDGKQLLTATSTGLFEVLDLADGKKVRSFNVCINGVKCLVPSVDGKRLLVGLTHLATPRPNADASDKQDCPRGEAVLIDLTDGRVLQSLAERTEAPSLVAVSPKGPQILIGDSLWDTNSGQKLVKLCNKPIEVFSAAFAPDGKRILLANHSSHTILGGMFDGLFGQPDDELASLVEIPTGKELAKFEMKQRVEGRVAMSFTADGKRTLLATRDGIISVWDAATAKKMSESRIPCTNLAAAFSSDGKLAAISCNENKTVWWDREKGDVVAENDREKAPPSRPGIPPQTSRDGKLQIAMADDGTGIVVREVADPTKSQTFKADLTPYEGIRAMGFDANDERYVYAEISSPFAGLWDVDAGRKLHQFALDEPFSAELLAFLPDGSRVVTAGDDGQVVTWDPTTGKKLSGVAMESPIMAITPSADGKSITVGCADRTAVVVQLASSAKTVLRGHEGLVDAVAIRPDGKLLVTASREDGTARLWDIASGKELARIVSVAGNKDWFVFTPEGLYDGSEGGRKLVAFRIGDKLDVQPAEQFSAEFYQPRPGLLGKIWGGK